MKVAVIIDTWFPAIGGGQINAWEISKRLASKELQIEIITRNNGKDNFPDIKYLTITKLGKVSKPNDQLAKIRFSINTFLYILKNNYNLIHIHPFLPAPFVKIAAIIKQTPLILTVHGTRLFEKRLQITPSRILEWIILTRIKYNLVISVTEAYKKIKNLNKNIVVIKNGIDTEQFEKIKIKKASYPKILWVGRFDKVKNVDKLIMSMPAVLNKIPKAKLMLVGYGYEEGNLKQLTSKIKLENIVIFKGKIQGEELIKEYKSSHLFVLPSESEGQPLTLLEALVCKLPILASNTGDISQFIRDKNMLLKTNHTYEISESIIKFFESSKKFSDLIYAKEVSDWSTIAKMVRKLYYTVQAK